MRITVCDIDGNEAEMPSVVSMTIAREEDVPADIFSGVFVYDDDLPELKSVSVTNESKMIFKGNVDKQTLYCGNGISLLKLTCRSMTSALLDSEAYPRCYVLPSIDVLYEACLKPYGIKGVIGKCGTFSTAYVVNKGMSNWQVIDDFCTRFLNIKPIITPDGYLDISGDNNCEDVLFSNSGGYMYSEMTKTLNRHNQISHVMARLSLHDDYSYTVTNSEAVERGIHNIRYLNCAEMPNEYLSLADKIIENSKKNSVEYTLKCPYMLLDVLGAKATLNDEKIHENGLRIAACEYHLDSSGEYTEIKLRKDI